MKTIFLEKKILERIKWKLCFLELVSRIMVNGQQFRKLHGHQSHNITAQVKSGKTSRYIQFPEFLKPRKASNDLMFHFHILNYMAATFLMIVLSNIIMKAQNNHNTSSSSLRMGTKWLIVCELWAEFDSVISSWYRVSTDGVDDRKWIFILILQQKVVVKKLKCFRKNPDTKNCYQGNGRIRKLFQEQSTVFSENFDGTKFSRLKKLSNQNLNFYYQFFLLHLTGFSLMSSYRNVRQSWWIINLTFI